MHALSYKSILNPFSHATVCTVHGLDRHIYTTSVRPSPQPHDSEAYALTHSLPSLTHLLHSPLLRNDPNNPLHSRPTPSNPNLDLKLTQMLHPIRLGQPLCLPLHLHIHESDILLAKDDFRRFLVFGEDGFHGGRHVARADGSVDWGMA